MIVDKDGNPLTGTLILSGDAGASDVLSGKTFYTTNPKSKQTGTMGTMGGGTYTPKAAQQTVSCSGKKMTGNIVIKGIKNLTLAIIYFMGSPFLEFQVMCASMQFGLGT